MWTDRQKLLLDGDEKLMIDKGAIPGPLTVAIKDEEWKEFEEICGELDIQYEVEHSTVWGQKVRIGLRDYCKYSEAARSLRWVEVDGVRMDIEDAKALLKRSGQVAS